MKRYALILALILLAITNVAQAEEITVTVKGMVCSFCAQGIKKTFSKNASVSSVTVNLDQKRVDLTTKEQMTLTDTEIEKTINDAGYDMLKIERR